MNRRAIIYTRVSTEDQKVHGNSLQDQERRLLKKCEQEDLYVVKHYQDDYSAKDFNRPAFNQMLEDIKQKKVKAEILLCTKWDRFTRNSGLFQITRDKLAKLGVYVNVLEGGTKRYDYEEPSEFLQTGIQVLFADFDNKMRADNVTRGMRQARLNGLWNGTTPRGYSYDRSRGRGIIVPNEIAKYIQESFQLFSKGAFDIEEVRKIMSKKGFKCSRNSFNQLLKNPVYIGKIKIKAWKEEDEVIINGLHDPIIKDDIFYIVQDIINKRRRVKNHKNCLDDNLPLRGFLICKKCGCNLTGSPSRSHTGTRYNYYHCQRNKGCKESFRADEANMQFIQLLDSFHIPDEVLDLYYHIMKDIFKKDDKQRDLERVSLQKQIQKLNERIEQGEEKVVDGVIDNITFQRVKSRSENDINEIKSRIQGIDLLDSNYMKYIKYDFAFLKNIKEFYMQAETSVKQKIVSSIFPEKLIYEDNIYRTPKVNKVLELLTSNINELGQIKKGKKSISENLSLRVRPQGIEP